MPVPIVNIFATADYEGQIRRGADALKKGGVVVLPTETVYGAAGLITLPSARDQLRELRGGGSGRPFTIHLARPADALEYVGEISDFGHRLMQKLWPGPVGLIFDVPAARRAEVAGKLGLAESDLYDVGGTITLRCPDHLLAQDVIQAAGGPVGLTRAGADLPGVPTAKTAADLEGKVDLIFDAGPTRFHKPSTILKVEADGYNIVRHGIYDERIIEKLLRTTILFVCSGNTCRSPMAEALARHLLAESRGVTETELEKEGISVLSAGAFAMPGARATPQAVDAVREHGADLTSHRSRPLTVELIHQADAIYTMGRGHAAAVMALVPGAADKVTTLDPAGDIEDPIGGDLSLYEELAGQLKTLIGRRLKEKELIRAN